MLDSAFEEMQHSAALHQIPSKDSLLSVESKDEDLNWNALETFSKNDNQSDNSFNEQRNALVNLTDAIRDYCDPCRQHLFTKARTIVGFPGEIVSSQLHSNICNFQRFKSGNDSNDVKASKCIGWNTHS